MKTLVKQKKGCYYGPARTEVALELRNKYIMCLIFNSLSNR
jgi:hypothetical protein